jgi:DDE superfamily endonuclease
MSNEAEVVAQPIAADPAELSRLFEALFCSFPRADQRRWAETYVQGLIQVPGRKSIRRIAEQVVGYRADQSLQQFLNQSPWPVAPVQHSLARQLSAAVRPRAWAVEEVAFPRRGTKSVAVARQHVASLGRVVNCQVGVAVLMAANAGGCPVNWRLTIPESWDRDADRRSRAHLPDRERHRPSWQYVLAVLGEMIDTWGLPPAPVLVDSRRDPQPEPLLRGLESRGLQYAVRVRGDAATGLDGCGGGAGATSGPASARFPTAAELAASIPVHSRVTPACWDAEHGQLSQSQFAVAPVPSEEACGIPPSHTGRPARYVVAEWSVGQARPEAIWITNLNTPPLPYLIGLLWLGRQAKRVVQRLQDESGLRHFEGRSFRGWHHHVTLVSVAHAYRLLCELGLANRGAHHPDALGGRHIFVDQRWGDRYRKGGRHASAGSRTGPSAPRQAARVPA